MRELYQVVEVGPAWYQDNIPCQEACPVRTNCRGYLNLAAAGEFEKAWELALDPNPMASICGSVCAAPCETACRRKEVDKPLSIRYVKKFLSDWTHQNVRVDGHGYTQPAAPVFGKPSGRVAVVGAGCAGLSAASDLAKLGFGFSVLSFVEQRLPQRAAKVRFSGGGSDSLAVEVFRFREVFEQGGNITKRRGETWNVRARLVHGPQILEGLFIFVLFKVQAREMKPCLEVFRLPGEVPFVTLDGVAGAPQALRSQRQTKLGADEFWVRFNGVFKGLERVREALSG